MRVAEAPGEVLGAGDADAGAGEGGGDGGCGSGAGDAAVGGEQDAGAVGGAVDAEGAGEFAGAGCELVGVADFRAALAHGVDAGDGFEGAEEDESGAVWAFDEDVEEPVDAVVEVDVGGAGGVGFDEGAGAGAEPGVAGGVVCGVVGFGFHDDAGGAVPVEVAADEFARAGDGVAGEEGLGEGRHGGGRMARGWGDGTGNFTRLRDSGLRG